MTQRERFLATADFKPVNRAYLLPTWTWPETVRRWKAEGLPTDADLSSCYKTDTELWPPIHMQGPYAPHLMPPLERYYVPRMKAVARQHRTRQWLADNRAVVRQVLARIRAEGSLCSADFVDERGRRGSWWDWKPAKRALETLFWTGELMIAGRRNSQRL